MTVSQNPKKLFFESTNVNQTVTALCLALVMHV